MNFIYKRKELVEDLIQASRILLHRDIPYTEKRLKQFLIQERTDKHLEIWFKATNEDNDSIRYVLELTQDGDLNMYQIILVGKGERQNIQNESITHCLDSKDMFELAEKIGNELFTFVIG